MEEVTGSTAGKPKVVRIIYTDPDATDGSSSDENPNKNKAGKVVHVINLEERRKEMMAGKSQPSITAPMKQKNNLVGVRMQKSGRFGSEIRNPFTKKRIWLGTFTTPEEASRAYLAKKSEIVKEKLRREIRVCSSTGNSSSVQTDGSDFLTGEESFDENQ